MTIRHLLPILLLAACGERPPETSPTPEGTKPPSPSGARPPAEERPGTPKPAPHPPGNLPPLEMLPPSVVGEARTELSGCLQGGRGDLSDEQRFPPPQGEPAAAEVTVAAVSRGAIVTHELTHACCLGAQVKTTVSGKVVTVREALTGTPCDCHCRSTIATAVGLAPAEYTVRVDQAQGTDVRHVYEGKVLVRGRPARP